ncbi:MAG: RNA methyltransferase [bacterium]
MTNNQAKLIRSLHDKKNRQELGLFLVEGAKSVIEVLQSTFEIEQIFCTSSFSDENFELLESKAGRGKIEITEIFELEKAGTLETNDAAIAIVKQRPNTLPIISEEQITLALDDVRDPGNLGTIIRIADWYGIKNIIASKTTTDFYNSKVISASKGSFTRVNIFYTDLKDFLSTTKLPILGAFMEGQNVHDYKFPNKGILIMGNESNGICKETEELVTEKITIPRFGQAESLNVGIATAIILDNWKR